jgi:hypothetical protein
MLVRAAGCARGVEVSQAEFTGVYFAELKEHVRLAFQGAGVRIEALPLEVRGRYLASRMRLVLAEDGTFSMEMLTEMPTGTLPIVGEPLRGKVIVRGDSIELRSDKYLIIHGSRHGDMVVLDWPGRPLSFVRERPD